MKKYIEILQKCPVFDEIDKESIDIMLPCLGAKIKEYDKKETVFLEGENASYIGIVLAGTVQIEQVDYLGNRYIISEIKAGQLFLEAFACADVKKAPVSVIANEKSEILIIESDRILHPCENACGFHQKLIFNLMRNLAKKTIMLHQKNNILSLRTTREKLLTFLSYVSKEKGTPSFDIPFNREELADYLCVDRSGLSVEISKLKKEGIIKNRKNHFELIK